MMNNRNAVIISASCPHRLAACRGNRRESGNDTILLRAFTMGEPQCGYYFASALTGSACVAATAGNGNYIIHARS